MKTKLTAFALAAALVQPAAAVTFPSLTTIYVATGVADNGGADNTGFATIAGCSNVSGKTAQVRFLVLGPQSEVVGALSFSIDNGKTTRVGTHATASLVVARLFTGMIQAGVLNVESTASAMFCRASVIDAAATVPYGIDLHLVRVNPHPGTVE